MKKILIALLCMLTSLGVLSGCGSAKETELSKAYDAYCTLDTPRGINIFNVAGSDIPYVLQIGGNLYHYEDGELVCIFGENYIFNFVYLDKAGEYVYLRMLDDEQSYCNKYYCKAGEGGRLELIEEYRSIGEYSGDCNYQDTSGRIFTSDELLHIFNTYEFDGWATTRSLKDDIEDTKEEYFGITD